MRKNEMKERGAFLKCLFTALLKYTSLVVILGYFKNIAEIYMWFLICYCSHLTYIVIDQRLAFIRFKSYISETMHPRAKRFWWWVVKWVQYQNLQKLIFFRPPLDLQTRSNKCISNLSHVSKKSLCHLLVSRRYFSPLLIKI